MRKYLYLSCLLTSFLLFQTNGRSQLSTGNVWYNLPNYPTVRQAPVAFVINNIAYVGTGYNGSYVNDFAAYDPNTDSWTTKATMGGVGRMRASAFVVNGKGYVVGGHDVNNSALNDVWEYDPVADTWTQKANFPGGARSRAVGFAVNGKGYISTGQNSAGGLLNDLWEYSAATDTWTQKANFGGTARRFAAGFTIGNKGYIGTGFDGVVTNDFWEYDPTLNTWTQKANFVGAARQGAIGLATATKGYIGGGAGANDFCEYTPATNTWINKGTSFAGFQQGIGFSINEVLYAGLGGLGGQVTNVVRRYSPYWEVRNTTGDYDEAAMNNSADCFLYPLQYTGTWRGYVECPSNSPGCYAGFAVNTLQNLGNFCYRSRVDANAELRGGLGWFGNNKRENVMFARRNYQFSFQNQPSAPVGIELYYTRAEIDQLISSFNARYGTSKTYNDLVIVKYNGPNQDLDPANNTLDNADYDRIVPTMVFYGSSGQYAYAEFSVNSYSEFYLALAEPKTRWYVNDNSLTDDVFTTAIGNNSNPGSPSYPVASLQYAVDQAIFGDTIYADAGTYAEQVTINKGLHIIGAGKNKTSIVKPATGIVPPPGPFTETALIQTGDNNADVHIRDVSVTGEGSSGLQCIIIQGGGSVKNCKLLNGGQGIFFRVDPAIKTAVIEDNFIQNCSIGINCQGSGLTVSASRNYITGTNSYYSGFFAGLDFGPLPQLTIANNKIENYFGVGMLVNSYSGSYNNNSITGSNIAIQRFSGNTPNATCNWYGTTDQSEVASKISGAVTYTPWLTNGTDNDPVTIGFQPVAGSCNGQNKYYVNDNSQSGDVFTAAIGNNSNNGSAAAPFATINHALSQIQPGDSIFVDAGSYAEDVIITKAVVIKGAKGGINPGSLLSRGDESIWVPATNDPVNGATITVQSGNVVIDGFTIDGDNPQIAGSVTLNGADINKGMGLARFINNSVAHNNIIFKNNIVKNFYRYGVFLQSTNELPLSGNLISQNHFDNISAQVVDGNTGRQGRAIGLANNGYASVIQNVITRVHSGVWMSVFNATSQPAFEISGNTIESYRVGIVPGGFAGTAAHYLITGNNLSTANLLEWSVPSASTQNLNIGLAVGNASTVNGMTILGNTVTGADYGMQIGRITGSTNWQVKQNQISNSATAGIYYYSSLANNSPISFEDLVLSNNQYGIYADYLGVGGPLPLSFSNVTVQGGVTGLHLKGAQLALANNILAGISFNGQSGNYIQLVNKAFNGSTVEASSVSFEGKLPSQMTLAELFVTENKIAHRIDYDSVGFIRLKPAQAFLTMSSFNTTLPAGWGTVTTTADIQRAIAAVAAGDTIQVAAGNYSSADFTLAKAVAILGPNSSISPNDATNPLLENAGRNPEAVIAGTAITLGADGIELNGLSFNPGNKSVLIMNNSIYGKLKFVRNKVNITGGAFVFHLTGATAPNASALTATNYLFTDNRLDRTNTTGGLTFYLNYLKNVNLSNNTAIVSGSTPRNQTFVAAGQLGVVDSLSLSGNVTSKSNYNLFTLLVSRLYITGNKFYNASRGLFIQTNVPGSSEVYVDNNEIVHNEPGANINTIITCNNFDGSGGGNTVTKIRNNTITINATGVSSLVTPVTGYFAGTIVNPDLEISRNKITHTGNFSAITSAFTGISIGGKLKTAFVSNNELVYTGTNYSFVPANASSLTSSGIQVATDAGVNSIPSNGVVAITNNKIAGYKQSVIFYDASAISPNTYTGYGNLPAGVYALVVNNSFTGDSVSVNNGNIGQLVNAHCNWFGSAASQQVSSKVSANVSYSPWLANGTDSDIATGFQPVAGACNGTPIVITLDSKTDITCFGANNGSITTTISGGAQPYVILWTKDLDPGYTAATGDISNLAPGNYHLSVTDANGSIATLDVNINEPELLTATASGTNNLCYGNTTGSATVLAEGGTAPYTYSWSNGATTDEINNLAAGVYTVTVTDANGCTAVSGYEVIQPALLTVVVSGTSTSCANTATASVGGGTPGYSYQWSNGAATSSITSVPAGTYTVMVTDANGCTASGSVTLTANEAFNPSANVVNVSCNGGTDGSITVTNVNAVAPFMYSIDGGLTFQEGSTFSGLPAGNYTIAVRDANGCTGFVTKTITQPAALVVTVNNVSKTCFGSATGSVNVSVSGGTPAYSYQWSGPNGYASSQLNISGLAAGNYILIVTDNSGCTKSQTITVDAYSQITTSYTAINVLCKGEANGSIVGSATGGTGNGFRYLWNTGATTSSIINIGVGNYSVTITDSLSGCTTQRSFTISQPATVVSISTTKTNATGCGSLGTITVTASGGTPGYLYKLNSNGIYQSSNVFSGLYAGVDTVWVKDANGCTKSAVVTITDNGSDEFEGNNSKNQAKPITLNTSVNARIALATDVADWFRFTTTAAGTYSITFTHPSASFAYNLYASGNNTPALLPSASNGTSKSYVLLANTTYYISITGGLSYTCYTMQVAATGTITKANTANEINVEKPEVKTETTLTAKVYPNPHNGQFTIQVNAPVAGNGLIELFSITGKKVTEKRSVFTQGDANTVSFTGMGQQVYIYKVTIGDRIVTGKIIGVR